VLHAAETFVGAHCSDGIRLSGRQVGADHIDAVERGLSDAEGFWAKVNVSSVMLISDSIEHAWRAKLGTGHAAATASCHCAV
jgi:hypothetical protein